MAEWNSVCGVGASTLMAYAVQSSSCSYFTTIYMRYLRWYRFGYRFDPELIPILTKLFILYPICKHLDRPQWRSISLCLSYLPYTAAGLSLISAITLLPVLCTRGYRWYPFPLFAFVALLAFLTSAAALAVAVVAWVTAIDRFKHAGFTATLTSGPCVSFAPAFNVV